MLTHNTHYASNDEVKPVGFAIYDIVKSKYFTVSSSWSANLSKAYICSSRQIVKELFPQSRFFAHPVFVDKGVCHV